MHRRLLQSRAEEGGKLLGYQQHASTHIDNSNARVELTIEDYIDSGPNLGHSEVHIMPDGDYQEKLFRVIERLEPRIDHVGTWHSHHSNGLETLSKGDIDGYFESVNSPNYNLDYFVAYLVKKLNRTSIDGDFYLFVRGENDFSRLPQRAITIVRGRSTLSDFLEAAEGLSSQRQLTGYRSDVRAQLTRLPVAGRQSAPSALTQSSHNAQESSGLIEDREWFNVHFPDAEIRRGILSGKLSWKWSVGFGNQTYKIRCMYEDRDKLVLEATNATGKIVKHLDLSFNNERHGAIMSFIDTLTLPQVGHADNPTSGNS